MVGDLFGALIVGFLLLWGIKTFSRGAFVRSAAPKRQGKWGRRVASEQPRILYHGTKLETAFEIYESGLWMVGKSQPAAIWMGDSFNIARAHARNNEGIVVIRAHPNLGLTRQGRGVYIFKIPDARPYQDYYRVEGLTPIGVLDSNGDKIR